MPRLYTDANPSMIAYVLDGGGSGYQYLQPGFTSTEAEYLGIIYGLNEYFLKWNKELDARQSNMNAESRVIANVKESKGEVSNPFFDVASPADKSKRPLPPPVLVCCDNEVVVKQLQRVNHIGHNRIRKLAQRVWQMTENVDVKFEWVRREENLAGKMLK